MREVSRNGTRWRVREADTSHVPGARGEHCLIFESDGLIRRVWSYPHRWNELSEGQLVELLEATPAIGPLSMLPSSATVSQSARSFLAELRVAHELRFTFENHSSERVDECRRARAQMREAVTAYAESLRHQGVPPERALVLLKDAVQSGLAGLCSDETVAEELLHEGVEWCIAAYYAA